MFFHLWYALYETTHAAGATAGAASELCVLLQERQTKLALTTVTCPLPDP